MCVLVLGHIKATGHNIKSGDHFEILSLDLLSSCLQSISICLFTKSCFLQLILPLLSYNSMNSMSVSRARQMSSSMLRNSKRCFYKSISETTAFDQGYFRGRLNTSNGG